MKAEFYDFVAKELKMAIPADWKRVPVGKLPGRKPFKISMAFRSIKFDGKSKLINVLILPMSLELDDYEEYQLVLLRDRILSKGEMLVAISEEERAGSLGATGQFIEESLWLGTSNFLWIICNRDQKLQASVESELLGDLHTVIRELWQGEFEYDGPTVGLQQVNLEMMQDKCPKCRKRIMTVTGIVFPNLPLDRWDNYYWLYYNRLVPLSEIGGDNARSIREFVQLLRKVDGAITPLRLRQGRDEEAGYLVANCPYCKGVRGDFDVDDDRMEFLHSLDSRMDGKLKYYSISLRIGLDVIKSLNEGGDGCDHACVSGWVRK